jgi:hypothetical protein
MMVVMMSMPPAAAMFPTTGATPVRYLPIPLAAASGGGRLGCKNVGRIQQGIRHLYPNHVITPTADGATGVVDMLMIGLGGDPNKIEYDGYYEDVYVKTAQGWRFQARTHHAVLVEGKRATPPAGATSPPGTSR